MERKRRNLKEDYKIYKTKSLLKENVDKTKRYFFK